MKKITVTGGKGGTGKSTFAVLLANKFTKQGKRVILVDCDIECPNDYLLLGRKLSKPVKKVYAKFPELNKSKCQKCGKCVKVCKSKAIFMAPGQYPQFLKELCSGCGACWIICPNKAIKAKSDEIGKIFVDKLSEEFYLITGLARPALEETSPVVREMKKFVSSFAKKIKADYIIFDTVAGTHCPVIMALLDNDFAYVVTEPTPLGDHDLNLILGLLKKMKLPAKIILNQADLGNKESIQPILKKFDIKKITQEIPYSKKIVKAYSQGKLLGFQL